MNARLYDPVVGRFLSPDPYVQAPDFSQNFNRYSYGLNNPLRFNDPSGNIWQFVVGGLLGGVINWVAHGAQFTTDGLAYFGIGAAIGVAGMATGGAAFAALAGTGAVAGTGGAIVGAVAGMYGYCGASIASIIGNNMIMGDPMPTLQDQVLGMGISIVTGGVMNGTMATMAGRNFWTGELPAYGRSLFAFSNTPTIPAPANIEAKPFTLQNIQKPGANLPQSLRNPNLSNAELVQIAGEEATANIPGKNNIAGILRHSYTKDVIREYQNVYGNRGLVANEYFKNIDTGVKGFLDIRDINSKIIYDYKWGYPNKSLDWFYNSNQIIRYQNQYPDYTITIIRF